MARKKVSIKIAGSQSIRSIRQALRDAGIESYSTAGDERGVMITVDDTADTAQVQSIAAEALRQYNLRELDTWDADGIASMTPAQIANHIDNNVTDLATARAYLKKLSNVVLYLVKRLEAV